MRVFRSQASRLGFDVAKVCVVGLSAGEHLAASLGLSFFVRHHRSIDLTNAGRILLEKARTAAETATDLRAGL